VEHKTTSRANGHEKKAGPGTGGVSNTQVPGPREVREGRRPGVGVDSTRKRVGEYKKWSLGRGGNLTHQRMGGPTKKKTRPIFKRKEGLFQKRLGSSRTYLREEKGRPKREAVKGDQIQNRPEVRGMLVERPRFSGPRKRHKVRKKGKSSKKLCLTTHVNRKGTE